MITHDYTKRFWGHDYTIINVIDGGQELRMMGWGYGIDKGDYMLLDDQKGDSTRYKVKSIKYLPDPKDMWSMVCTFAPRQKSSLQNVG